MPEEPTNTDGAQDVPQSTDTPDAQDAGGTGDISEGDISALPEWAQQIIRETRSEAAERRVALKKLQDEQRKREQKMLEEQGNYKALAEQRAQQLAEMEPYKERAESYETAVRELNENRLKQIREDMRSLVPDSLGPLETQKWLDRNWQLLTRPQAGNIDAGAGSGGSSAPKLTDEEKAMARASGMSEQDYAKAKARSSNRDG